MVIYYWPIKCADHQFQKISIKLTCKCKITIFHYINTNEIPGELLRKNLISSHVKITCYLHMWKYHRCYGYIINRAFHTKKLLKWNGLVFHWCLYNKKNITWPLGDTKFLFSCWKNISLVRLEEKFRISTWPCNILYFFSVHACSFGFINIFGYKFKTSFGPCSYHWNASVVPLYVNTFITQQNAGSKC